MTLPRKFLERYHVSGVCPRTGKLCHESFESGRDAYILQSFYKRMGYKKVTIRVS